MSEIAEWKGEGKASPDQERDLIREIRRLIEKKQLRAELVDKRTGAELAGDPCTHCTSCPCMFIG
jgi:hypothetical protein